VFIKNASQPYAKAANTISLMPHKDPRLPQCSLEKMVAQRG
jgi:hypothetical protein